MSPIFVFLSSSIVVSEDREGGVLPVYIRSLDVFLKLNRAEFMLVEFIEIVDRNLLLGDSFSLIVKLRPSREAALARYEPVLSGDYYWVE